MQNEPDDERLSKRARTLIDSVFVTSIPLWFVLWYSLGGFSDETQFDSLYIPLILCPLLLVANLWLWRQSTVHANFDKEVARIAFLENYGYYLTTAIVGALIVAVTSISIKGSAKLPAAFVSMEAAALLLGIVGVLYVFWIPVGKPLWLFYLRYLKLIPFTYSVCLFAAGVMVLIQWLGTG